MVYIKNEVIYSTKKSGYLVTRFSRETFSQKKFGYLATASKPSFSTRSTKR